MKPLISIPAIALIACSHAFANDTASSPAVDPATVKQTAEQLTPEQKQAMKDQARNTAQAKQAAWQQLSPEDKQAKREAMRGRMMERATQFRSAHHR